jgi:hypothetical protein
LWISASEPVWLFFFVLHEKSKTCKQNAWLTLIIHNIWYFFIRLIWVFSLNITVWSGHSKFEKSYGLYMFMCNAALVKILKTYVRQVVWHFWFIIKWKNVWLAKVSALWFVGISKPYGTEHRVLSAGKAISGSHQNRYRPPACITVKNYMLGHLTTGTFEGELFEENDRATGRGCRQASWRKIINDGQLS